MGKTKKIDRAFTLTGLLVVAWSSERNQLRLRRMNGQSEAGETLGENLQEPLGIALQFTRDDEVIGKAN